MRFDRHTVLLVASLAMLVVGATVEARILGSKSPQKSDCYLVFEGITANVSGKPNAVTCTDGDPSCDGDTVTGQCTFTFTACVDATDTGIVGCSPGEITKLRPKKAHRTVINYPLLPASAPACATSPTSIVLQLRRNGHSTRTTINFAATATGRPRRDADRLVLRCDPRPPSTAGAFVMREE